MSETSTETAGQDPEELFPPRPGGLVDTHRRHQAKIHGQAEAAAAAPSGPRKVRPVTVKVRQPDDWGAKTITLAPGQSGQAMPADPGRKRGLVNLVTGSAQVLVAKDRSAADSGTGYTLTSGQAPVEFGHQREVWLANPAVIDGTANTTAITVSVFTESYSRE